jgi:hypothetical protein
VYRYIAGFVVAIVVLAVSAARVGFDTTQVFFYGLWFMVYGLWFMVYGLWFMVYGLWFMVYGLWFMVYGLWYGSIDDSASICQCNMAHGTPICHPGVRALLRAGAQRRVPALLRQRGGEEPPGGDE